MASPLVLFPRLDLKKHQLDFALDVKTGVNEHRQC